LLDKLRGLFRRHDDCCDAPCGNPCGPVGAPVGPVGPGTPDKMPTPKPTTIGQNGMMVRVEGALADADAREPSPSYHVRGIEPMRK